jgi:serine/threonine protein kinase
MTYTGLQGTVYHLEATPFKSGGEGKIYHIPKETGKTVAVGKKVAKIYHAVTPELENKLKYMVVNPPDPSVLNQVAWPLDVVYDASNKFSGFVMPELKINAELKDVYQYPPSVGLSSTQKVIIAENICAVISAVHNAGYVFGDFNPCNIGVDKGSGKVAFLDTDSYHVFDKTNNTHYRCKVCADGYAAPELLEICANHAAAHPKDSKQTYAKAKLPTFTKETDNFALAIHVFKLLMNGFTPFGGIIETITPSQASPSMGNAAVRRNEYSFRPGYKPMSPAVPPLDIFPQEIADLFTRAFLVIGTIDPSQRPSSIEWHQALTRYEASLVDCPNALDRNTKKPLHQYHKKNSACPFCEADVRYQNAISGNKGQQTTSPSTPVSPLQQKTYGQPQTGSGTPTSTGTYGGGARGTAPVITRPPTPPPTGGLSWFAKIAIIAVSLSVVILGAVFISSWFSSSEVDGRSYDSAVYTGAWAKGKPNGSGVLASNTWTYEGSFADGLYSGKGKITWSDGSWYEGDWQDGTRNGTGTHTWSDGTVYVGSWKDGAPWNGRATFADGSFYDYVNGQ